MTGEKRSSPAARGRSAGKPGSDALEDQTQVAAALRSAYEEAVREDVPTEFLDLLDKLS